MRPRWIGLCLLLSLSALAGHADPAQDAASAASALLAGMDAAQRKAVLYDFDDDERFDLRLAPLGLEGLRMDALSPDQQAQLQALLSALLSEDGLAKVNGVRSQEREVEAMERAGNLALWVRHVLRGEERYHLSLFGEPSAAAPWGLRFDGHHLSFNAAFAPGALPATSPFFLGSQPRVVPEGMARAGFQLLEEEEDLARALYASLDPQQRTQATLKLEPGRGLFSGDVVRLEPGVALGVSRGALRPEQQAQLDALVQVYLGNLAPPLAEARWAALDPASFTFAWAGGALEGEPAYYRVQGASFVLEFDNSLPDADHVHTIWRDFDGDFGMDLLALHRAAAHGDAQAQLDPPQ